MLGILLAATVALLTLIIYWKNAKYYTYWKKKGVPYEKPVPLFGNFFKVMTLRESLGTFYTDMYMKYRKIRYVGFYELTEPVIMILDPKLIGKILVKDFSHFVNRNLVAGNKQSEVSMMLPALKDSEWRGVRYKLIPAFSSGKLKNMFQYMINCANTLSQYLEKVNHTEVDLKEAMTQFSLDIISNCAFGIDVSKDKHSNSEFRVMGRSIFNLNTIGYYCYLIVLSVPKLAAKLKLSLVPDKVGSYFAKIIKETFAIRKEYKIVRNDFVDLLLQLKEKGSIDVQVKDAEDSYLEMDYKPTFETFEITDQILISQAFSFLTGGFDGLSTPMMFVAYELARNPDIQEKLRKEIHDQISLHGGFSYEVVKKMTYLENCVHECLRMYPLNPFIFRICGQDYKLEDGTVIEAGTKVVIPIDGLQHDPQYFPEPDQFKPERFESRITHHTTDFTYLPFGAGPRMCIAMRFSLVALKVGIATFIKDYQLSLSPQFQHPIEFRIKTFFVKAPKDIIYLNFKKLSPIK